MMRRNFGVLALLLIGHPCRAPAQTPATATKPLEFEIATIKPSAPDERGSSMEVQPGGALLIRNATIKQLVSMAYQLREFQISGGPGWITTDHFDIEAKSGAPAVVLDYRSMTEEQRKDMDRIFKERMKSLLTERFQFSAR